MSSRFCAGSTSAGSPARGKDLALLSKPLRARLLAQAFRSEDDDKQKRARNAFAEEP